jgi:phosphoribosylformylglycinamidine synthase
MLFSKYSELNQDIFTTDVEPEPILDIDDIAYNKTEGLSLSPEKVGYLDLAVKIARKLTPRFSSHKRIQSTCRHKIFNRKIVLWCEDLRYSN